MDAVKLQHVASNEACTWDAVTDTAAVQRRRIPARLCGWCGASEDDAPLDTAVTDWRTVLVCDGCVELHDWQDYSFDPIGNTYTHR